MMSTRDARNEGLDAFFDARIDPMEIYEAWGWHEDFEDYEPATGEIEEPFDFDEDPR